MLATLDTIESKRASLVPRLERLQDGDGSEQDRTEALDEVSSIKSEYQGLLTMAEEANLGTLDEGTRASIGSIKTMAENQTEVFNALEKRLQNGTVEEVDDEVIEKLKPPE